MMNRWKHQGLFVLLLALAACSSDSGDGGDPIPSTGNDPMRFTSLAKGTEAELPQTRASSSEALTTGFLVSTYKQPSTGAQQTVMNKYEAKYHSPNQWDIYGSTPSFWQQQDVRYWDLSATSYRFHAIAPCPNNIPDVTLSDVELKLPANNDSQFHNETCIDGVLSSDGKEPFYVAQVERQLADAHEAHDYDRLLVDEEINKANGYSPTRPVALPFHHLMSKVRFGLYTSVPQLPDDSWLIKSVTIKARNLSGNNIVYQANGYHVTGNDANLLSGYFIVPFNEGSETVLITTHQQIKMNECIKQSPFFLQCEDGILQIPQDNVQLEVTMVWSPAGRPDETVTKVLVPPTGSSFSWESNVFYTYYIIITDTEKIQIELTASITAWDTIAVDINGSLEN